MPDCWRSGDMPTPGLCHPASSRPSWTVPHLHNLRQRSRPMAAEDILAVGARQERTMVETAVEHLFNGSDLDGWEHVGPGSFSVEDGLLTSHGGMGLTWYTCRMVGDAVLRVVWRVG